MKIQGMSSAGQTGAVGKVFLALLLLVALVVTWLWLDEDAAKNLKNRRN